MADPDPSKHAPHPTQPGGGSLQPATAQGQGIGAPRIPLPFGPSAHLPRPRPPRPPPPPPADRAGAAAGGGPPGGGAPAKLFAPALGVSLKCLFCGWGHRTTECYMVDEAARAMARHYESKGGFRV